MKYIPRLDSFRAIAALLIVHHHYFRDLLPPTLQFDTSFGVSFFFVLSGFLITKILLEDCARPRGVALAQFYIRRSFRIFPLYYFVLMFGLALNIPGFWNSLPWSPLYLVNVGIMAHGFGYFGNVSHFWTLAIEEQFYLFWPLVVLTLAPRGLWIATVSIIGAAALFRFALITTGTNFIYALSILGSCDMLGLGALGALACRSFGPVLVERILRPMLLLGIPAVFIGAAAPLHHFLPDKIFLSIGLTAPAVAFLWLVVRAQRDGPQGNSWGGRWLPAIGRISYGIYVWHFVLLWLAPKIEAQGWSPLLVRSGCLTATFVAAWLTYRLFEAPLRSFGRSMASRLNDKRGRLSVCDGTIFSASDYQDPATGLPPRFPVAENLSSAKSP